MNTLKPFVSIAAISVALICSSSAQDELNISILNSQGPELALPGGQAPVPIGTTVRVGVIGAGADTSSLTGILASFVEFGSTTVGDSNPGLLNRQITASSDLAGISTEVGQQLTVVVGDSDLAFAAFNEPAFVTEAFVGGGSPRNTVEFNFNSDQRVFLPGAGSFNPTSGFLAAGQGAIELAAVPEPSAAGLIGLAVLGLVARRKR